MDLVRMILLVLENHPEETMRQAQFIRALHKQSPELRPQMEALNLVEHIELMQEAGLVTAEIYYMTGGSCFDALRMTWAGHDFLADAKNEVVWKKVKSLGTDMSLTVLKQSLVKVATDVAAGLLK